MFNQPHIPNKSLAPSIGDVWQQVERIMETHGFQQDKTLTLAEYEDLLERTTTLKKSLRMVTKITNSEKLLNLDESLKEILPVLPGTIKDLKTLALESENEDRKRYAHMGVQFQELEKILEAKQPEVTTRLKSLSKKELEFLGLDSEPDGDADGEPDADSGEETA